MVGKSPHRAQGKKGPDQYDLAESKKPIDEDPAPEVYKRNLDELQRKQGGQADAPHEWGDADQVAGSRPGVASRVKERLDTLEERGETRGSRKEKAPDE